MSHLPACCPFSLWYTPCSIYGPTFGWEDLRKSSMTISTGVPRLVHGLVNREVTIGRSGDAFLSMKLMMWQHSMSSKILQWPKPILMMQVDGSFICWALQCLVMKASKKSMYHTFQECFNLLWLFLMTLIIDLVWEPFDSHGACLRSFFGFMVFDIQVSVLCIEIPTEDDRDTPVFLCHTSNHA